MTVLTPEDLADTEIKDLRSITTDYGATWHHREKRETLVARICELSTIIQPHEKDQLKFKRDPVQPKPQHVNLTATDIANGLTSQIELGLLLKITPDAWHIRFRDKQDSGNFTMPIRTIQRCADSLLFGRGAMPKCSSCGQENVYDDSSGYICVNSACKKQVKPSNPGKTE